MFFEVITFILFYGALLLLFFNDGLSTFYSVIEIIITIVSILCIFVYLYVGFNICPIEVENTLLTCCNCPYCR